MIIKQLIDEDFVNYKKPSMFIGFPLCSWKCEVECGEGVCQNGSLANSPDINISIEEICNRYMENDLTHALVLGGLEPFDTWDSLLLLISHMRKYTDDDIVIYTGYYSDEVTNAINILKSYPNIIVKFGRYIPNQNPHFDDILGVDLASDNQYAKKIS